MGRGQEGEPAMSQGRGRVMAGLSSRAQDSGMGWVCISGGQLGGEKLHGLQPLRGLYRGDAVRAVGLAGHERI